MEQIIIGKEEWLGLPLLGLPVIKARIDSGAKTSSLHALNITPYEEDSKKYVVFDVQPVRGNRNIVKRCKAELIGRRLVKSSSGEAENRFVIKTNLLLGKDTFEIEVTLTNRDSMDYRMLLGREAMHDKILINPNKSFYQGEKSDKEIMSFYKKSTIEKKGLKIVLLASNADLYSNKRIMEAGKQRGHDISFVNVKHCYMDISSNNQTVYYRGGKRLDNIDAIIPRIKPSMTFYGTSVIRQFESLSVFSLNSSVAISRSRDKLRSLQILSNNKINLPTTSFANSPIDTKELIKMVGGAPLVIKLLEGTQGKGVVLAETNKAAESVISAFKSLKANILVQEFVKEAEGRDVRCFVIGNKVVAAIERVAAPGEFRANLHLGGSAGLVKLSSAEKKTAINAAKAMDLKVAGVDIVRSKNGPKVLEVNSSPGLEGVESITGIDLAALMIEIIEMQQTKRI
ncbi:MAG: 30S ribosomal protein S6--L-glutamate ligase [Alphaproteobacteria bacterium]|nr:30S ribosomal protein S6--L-glutamate ligase [Alphaproteobacteria bacterium]